MQRNADIGLFTKPATINPKGLSRMNRQVFLIKTRNRKLEEAPKYLYKYDYSGRVSKK